MEFVCCKIRFTFWDGKKIYVVHFAPGVNKWYVFDGDVETNALESYDSPKKEKINYDSALYYLTEFLNK